METVQWGALHRALQSFLLIEGVSTPLSELWSDPQRQRPSAICYVEHGDQVLMLQRSKAPFAGCWTAPGGKLLPGEDPRQAVRREIHEETGLWLRAASLSMIVVESGKSALSNWLLFIFRSDDFVGRLGTCNEGKLAWMDRSELSRLPIPEVDRYLHPRIFSDEGRYLARVVFDASNSVADLHIQALDEVI